MDTDVIDYLQEHGLEIGNAAKHGNQTAKNVVDWYTIWSKSPGDNGAKVVLIEMVNNYRKEYESEDATK